ncbi:MAG: NUDIX hydrolase [Pseudomonadales bacterium]|nr:NUDIX hydrolase [Pseudomonadales bacterium]
MPKPEVSEPIPAATVVLLREREGRVEVLMLRKNAAIDFGGMWVFPGGCIEEEDYNGGDDIDVAARIAAARETVEETGIKTDPDTFVWFAHWTPPPIPQKRFRTWFYAAKIVGDDAISIDGEEIHDHCWINPQQALDKQKSGEIKVVAPTWVTLYYLSRYASVEALLERFSSTPPKRYLTHFGKLESGGRAVLWHGDAGYEAWDPSIAGDRHRLVIQGDDFTFENTVEKY